MEHPSGEYRPMGDLLGGDPAIRISSGQLLLCSPLRLEPNQVVQEAPMTEEPCKHMEQITNLDGQIIERRYTSLWCPKCHLRIVDNYQATPFKLRNR